MKKKNLLFIFVALLVAMLVFFSVTMAQGKEAYVVADGSTLTFYYDMQKASRTGKVYGIDETAEFEVFSRSYPAWIVVDKGFNSVTTLAVFDASFKDYRPKSTASWFFGCKKLEKIESIENLNTSEVTDMNFMFAGCSSLASLDLSRFDTENVTDLNCMFYNCDALTSLNVSNFDTKNVTDMSGMFYDCSSLTSLDVSNFDTKNVTDMRGMFAYSPKITTIYCNDTWKCEESEEMFLFCNKLVGAVAYSAGKTDVSMANPDTGYFTRKTADGIAVVAAENATEVKDIYTLDGRRQNEMQRGLNIVRVADGTVRKIIRR